MLIMDQRMSVIDLKIRISKELGKSIEKLIFMRGGAHGSEIKDDDISLKAASLYNNVCIYVLDGVPSKLNEKRLKFLIATPIVQTHMMQDNQFYDMQDLIELPVKIALTREVKEFLVQKVNELSDNPFFGQLDSHLLRFWEKAVDKITKVYLDDEFLERYSMFEGKEIAV